MPPTDYCLLRTGELAAKPIVKSALLGTVHMWIGKWRKPAVTQEIVKHFAEADVFSALKLLCEVCSLPAPTPRNDSINRTKGEQLAMDIYDTVQELDKRDKLPEILVPSQQLHFCPVETVKDSDPGILVRMENLEKAVMKMVNQPAVVQTVQQAAPRQSAVIPAGPAAAASVIVAPNTGKTAGVFGAALERARSLSRDGRQGQRGEGREQSGNRPDSYAERAAKRSRPGDVDGDGFRVPGRPARKPVPKGCSTVDLSSMNRPVVAPLDRYVGGINLNATEDDVREVLQRCAAALAGGDKMVFTGLEKLTGHPSARTQSWKFTVPYSCRQLLDNPALYPQGWTHRAYFAPRGDRNKRQKESGAGGAAAAPLLRSGGGEALLQEEMQLDDRQLEVLEMARVAETELAKTGQTAVAVPMEASLNA